MEAKRLVKNITRRIFTVSEIVLLVLIVFSYLYIIQTTASKTEAEVSFIKSVLESIMSGIEYNISIHERELERFVNEISSVLISYGEQDYLESSNLILSAYRKKAVEGNLSEVFNRSEYLVVDSSGKVLVSSGYIEKGVQIEDFGKVISLLQNKDFVSYTSQDLKSGAFVHYIIRRLKDDTYLASLFFISPNVYESYKKILRNFSELYGYSFDIFFDSGISMFSSTISKYYQKVSEFKEEKIYKGLRYIYLKKTIKVSDTANKTLILFVEKEVGTFYLIILLIALGTSSVFHLTIMYVRENILRPFMRDLTLLSQAVRELGNFSILPTIERFEVKEFEDFYETLSSMLQELTATLQEFEATNTELEAAYDSLQLASRKIERLLTTFTEKLAVVAEGYDEITGKHILRVKSLSKYFAEKLGLEKSKIEEIELFSPLHDVGKIFIPREILNKPGPLSPEEWEIMKEHTVLAQKILDVPSFETALNIALYHHENYDGSGYPFGLKGDEIPLEAKIVKLVDVYDALRSDRPYKKGLTHREVLEIITKGDLRTKPEHFDPILLNIFLENEKEIEKLWKQLI